MITLDMTAPATAPEETVCEVCDYAAVKRHPCRFERACSCWYDVPCNGTGAKYRAPRRKP